MYAVCVYWPFHLRPTLGAIIGGLVFLAGLASGLAARAKVNK